MRRKLYFAERVRSIAVQIEFDAVRKVCKLDCPTFRDVVWDFGHFKIVQMVTFSGIVFADEGQRSGDVFFHAYFCSFSIRATFQEHSGDACPRIGGGAFVKVDGNGADVAVRLNVLVFFLFLGSTSRKTQKKKYGA